MRDRIDGLDAVLGSARAMSIRSELGVSFCERARRRDDRLQPIETDLELIDTIDRVLGRAAMRAWAHDHAFAVARRGAFGAIVNNAVRLFGLSMHAMTRAAARAWTVTYRDMGRLVHGLVHQGTDPETIVMRWADAPEWAAEHGPFRASLESSLECCLTLIHREGEVLLGMSGGELRVTFTCAPMRAVG